MRRQGVVALEPAAQLREHRLGIPQLGVGDVVALEGADKRLGEAVALRALGRRRHRHQAQLVGVQDRGGCRVLGTVVAEPLHGVRRVQRRLAEARPEHAVH